MAAIGSPTWRRAGVQHGGERESVEADSVLLRALVMANFGCHIIVDCADCAEPALQLHRGRRGTTTTGIVVDTQTSFNEFKCQIRSSLLKK